MAYNTDIHPIPKFETKEQFPLGFNLPVCPHFYERLCPSVRLWVGLWVRNPFLKYRGNGDFGTIKHQEQRIQGNSIKFK